MGLIPDTADSGMSNPNLKKSHKAIISITLLRLLHISTINPKFWQVPQLVHLSLSLFLSSTMKSTLIGTKKFIVAPSGLPCEEQALGRFV